MSSEKRSALMARIRGKNTGPERLVGAVIKSLRLVPENHVAELPGRPDFVLRTRRIAIFVDGDFWHGWRFPAWKNKLSEKWEHKIASNRRRDALNRARLRRAGWIVLRIWEHEIEADPDRVRRRLAALLATRGKPTRHGRKNGHLVFGATSGRSAQ